MESTIIPMNPNKNTINPSSHKNPINTITHFPSPPCLSTIYITQNNNHNHLTVEDDQNFTMLNLKHNSQSLYPFLIRRAACQKLMNTFIYIPNIKINSNSYNTKKIYGLQVVYPNITHSIPASQPALIFTFI